MTITALTVSPGTSVPAPVTGLRLGTTRSGPVTLRLFRQDGTRIAVLGGVSAAHLLTLRAAAAGIPVGVVTGRPAAWAPLASGSGDFRIEPNPAPVADAVFLVDDTRAMDVGAMAPASAWQCRIELRTPWTPNDLLGLTSADAVIVGAATPDIASGVRSAFGLSRNEAGALTTLDPASVGVLHRGGIRFLTLDPTPAELNLLGRAR